MTIEINRWALGTLAIAAVRSIREQAHVASVTRAMGPAVHRHALDLARMTASDMAPVLRAALLSGYAPEMFRRKTP